MTPLVEALMQALVARGHKFAEEPAPAPTKDTEWDETKHPRSSGGQFTTGQHGQAADNHEAAAMAHGHAATMAGAGPMASMHTKASMMHTEAAEAHRQAAKHIKANTGLGLEYAKGAHAKTFTAAGHSKQMEKMAGGNSMGAAYAHLKKIASDPKQSVAARADAVEKLGKIEKAANAVAESPHAAAAEPMAGPSGNLPARRGEKGMSVSPMANVQARIDAKKGTAAAPAAATPQPATGASPAGPKPTKATAKAAKAATHELLSPGHPFSVDELMAATGVTTRSTMMTALADLKNPKYAGALGALKIEKTPDGMYRVSEAPAGGFKEVKQAPAGGAAPSAGAEGGAGTSSAAPAATDPHAVVSGSHPMSDYVPGDTVKAKVGKSTQPWKVMGHNAEGHVVLQRGDGTKHRMDPKALAAQTDKVKAEAAPPKREDSGVEVKHQPSGTTVPHQATQLKRMETRANNLAKPAPSALKEGMAAGLKKNIAQQKQEGKNRVQKALGNYSSDFVKQALAAQKPNPAFKKPVGPADMTRKQAIASQRAINEKAAAGPKPGPDGKPMGTHPEMANAARRLTENPSTTPPDVVAKAKMVVDPISHRTSMAGGVPHKSPEPGDPGYEQWKAARDKRLGKA
jgi:hypothetical protein